MSEQIVDVEADSLEAARKKLYKDDLIVLQESVLCRGEVETAEGSADTVEEAALKARSKVPAGAVVENTEVKISPERVVLYVGEGNEAVDEVRPKKGEVIEAIRLHKKGKKGFLGFGRTSNVYAVEVLRRAVVEVRFREKARLRGTVRGYLAADLLQSTRELELQGALWAENIQLLNPKNDPVVGALLDGYRNLDLPSGLGIIQSVCLKNQAAKWKRALEEAYEQAKRERAALDAELERQRAERRKAQIARARELQEQEKRLRELDHRLAEELMIYVALYWTPDYRVLKGIPRYEYVGPYHPPDPNDRKDIPRYSSDENEFRRLLNQVGSLSGHYSEVLGEGGLSETAASLEQKCLALLEARRRWRKG